MRLDWIEDLVALLDAGSLTQAAILRNVSQPAFTRRLRAAEEALGAQLLDRSVKPVRLRPGILSLEPRLRETALEIRQLRVDLRIASQEAAGSLVIATQHSMATTRASAIIEELHTLSPIEGVRLRSANRDECIGLVMAGEADLALVHREPGEQIGSRPSEMEVKGVDAERLIPVGTETDAVNIQEGRLRLIAYPHDVFLGKVFAYRIAPRLPRLLTLEPRAETALAPAAHSLARESSGVAWLPESISRTDIASGRLVDLSGTLPSTVLELCAIRTQRVPGAAANAAWRCLLSSFGGR